MAGDPWRGEQLTIRCTVGVLAASGLLTLSAWPTGSWWPIAAACLVGLLSPVLAVLIADALRCRALRRFAHSNARTAAFLDQRKSNAELYLTKYEAEALYAVEEKGNACTEYHGSELP